MGSAEPVTLAVIGNINMDLLVWPASEVPPPGAERAVERINIRVGGAAAIAGATLARLGADVIVAGCVGDDALGAAALEELGAYGVATGFVRRIAGSATGTSIAFEAPGRDRSFLISLASLSGFEPWMVPEEAVDASFVLFCGYFNLPSMRGRPTADLLRRVKEAGGTTLLDTGWDHDGWPETTREEIRLLLPSVDIFVPNEVEAEHLSGESDPVTAARSLSAVSAGWTVVKLGREGCVTVGPGECVLHAPASSVEVVDTTGAGDAFNAGLMNALSVGETWSDALRAASRLASIVVSRPSDDRYPTRAQLLT
jgi:sugar/nucleoside kinase (ribokinase family)